MKDFKECRKESRIVLYDFVYRVRSLGKQNVICKGFFWFKTELITPPSGESPSLKNYLRTCTQFISTIMKTVQKFIIRNLHKLRRKNVSVQRAFSDEFVCLKMKLFFTSLIVTPGRIGGNMNKKRSKFFFRASRIFGSFQLGFKFE